MQIAVPLGLLRCYPAWKDTPHAPDWIQVFVDHDGLAYRESGGLIAMTNHLAWTDDRWIPWLKNLEILPPPPE